MQSRFVQAMEYGEAMAKPEITNREEIMVGKCLLRGALLFLFLSILFTFNAYSMVRDHAIVIDGSYSDWAPALIDPENFVTDLSQEQGDPDSPGTSDRDLRSFGVTWDSTNLYLYFRRTFSGTNSMTLLAYVDADHDYDLDGNDFILRFDFNGATPAFAQLYRYIPSK